MMTLHILKSVDFRETPKSRYLDNKLLLFLQIRKFINYTSRATLWQKNTPADTSVGSLGPYLSPKYLLNFLLTLSIAPWLGKFSKFQIT